MHIDFHAHTLNSDGGDSMLTMVRQAYKVGLGAFVVTNHDRPGAAFASDYTELRTLNQSLGLGDSLPLPVVIGAEILTPFGEFLMFGTRAVENWYMYRDGLSRLRKDFNDTFWVETFEKYVLHRNSYSMWCGHSIVTYGEELPYALIMCHPRMHVNYLQSMPARFFDLLHGFEIENHEDFESTNPDVVRFLREHVEGGRELRNSDAHSAEPLGSRSNEISDFPQYEFGEDEPDYEAHLITWLRGTRHKPLLPQTS